jgi:predicted nucleic acid-binding Zn ribbon protein
MDAGEFKKIIYILFLDETILKYCPKCKKNLPKTEEYFFVNWKKGSGWWCTYCRKCDAKRVAKKNKNKYVHKLKQPKPLDLIKAREAKTSCICKHCDWEYPITLEYWNMRSDQSGKFNTSICKECNKERRATKWRATHHIEKGDGVWPIMGNPGEYYSEEEKKELFDIMYSMGWIYSKITLTWYKPSLKSKNNHWNFQTYKRKK